MLTREEFVRQSLELNLFFLRIMKEHAYFIAASFTMKNYDLMQKAEIMKTQLERLLGEVIYASEGVLYPDVLEAHELVTPFTLNAERATQFYTGLKIDSNLTKMELVLGEGKKAFDRPLEEKVFRLNQRAVVLTTSLMNFKQELLRDVQECRLFLHNYPSLLEHTYEEAARYVQMLERLQRGKSIESLKRAAEAEYFWNHIMGDHGKFIRGLLDPSEEELFDTANNFAKEFERLTEEAKRVIDKKSGLREITDKSLDATIRIRDFKASGTEGLLSCKVKAMILPLLSDHVLREANHYLRLLRGYKKGL